MLTPQPGVTNSSRGPAPPTSIDSSTPFTGTRRFPCSSICAPVPATAARLVDDPTAPSRASAHTDIAVSDAHDAGAATRGPAWTGDSTASLTRCRAASSLGRPETRSRVTLMSRDQPDASGRGSTGDDNPDTSCQFSATARHSTALSGMAFSNLNPPSTHVECGFKSRPGHTAPQFPLNTTADTGPRSDRNAGRRVMARGRVSSGRRQRCAGSWRRGHGAVRRRVVSTTMRPARISTRY